MKPAFANGVYTASITPVTAHGEVDTQAIGALMEYYSQSGLRGALIPSSSGEYFALTQQQRNLCITAAVQYAPSSFSILANITHSSQRAAVENAKTAADLGASAVVLMPPAFHHHTQDELFAFFTAVADESPLPLICYNHMTRLPNRLEEPLVLRLAQHPNIVGIKDTHNDAARLFSLREKLGVDSPFSIFVGGDGVVGFGALVRMPMLNALSAVMPQLFLDLHHAGTVGDIVQLCALQAKVKRLMSLFTVLHQGASSAALFSQALKAALSIKGLCSTHAVQMGYPVTSEEMDRVKALLEEVQNMP